MVAVRVGKTRVLLVNLGAQGVRAYDDRCPHAASPLSEGTLRDGTLRCGAHHWEFDVCSGAGVNPRVCRLRSFPAALVDGAILVKLGDEAS